MLECWVEMVTKWIRSRYLSQVRDQQLHYWCLKYFWKYFMYHFRITVITVRFVFAFYMFKVCPGLRSHACNVQLNVNHMSLTKPHELFLQLHKGNFVANLILNV